MSFPIDNKELTADMILDRSTIIYGASGSGKTTIAIDYLKVLKGKIEQVVIFSPTENQNMSYSQPGREIVPIQLIHSTVTDDKLKTIEERQQALVDVYNRARKPAVMLSLYSRIKNANTEAIFRKINKIYAEQIAATRKTAGYDVESDLIKLKQTWESYVMTALEKIIINYADKLVEMAKPAAAASFTADELFTCKFITLNPRLLVIFDDITAEIESIKKCKYLKNFLFKGRHMKMTILFLLHTDKAIATEIRSNAHITIFACKKSMGAYFARNASFIDNDDRERIEYYRSLIRCGEPDQYGVKKYTKLIYINASDTFYTYTARTHAHFSFCPPIVMKYCAQLSAVKNCANSDNRFARLFK